MRNLWYLAIIFCACCWALIGPLSRFSLARGIHPMEIAFWRMVFGSLCFMTHAACIKQYTVQNRKDILPLFLFGVFSVAGLFTSVLFCVQSGGAALASVLLYTAPAWVAVLSRIFLGNRFTGIQLAAVGVSLTGVAFVSASGGGLGGSVPLTAVVSGLASGFLYSTHFVVGKKFLQRYNAITFFGYGTLFGAVALFPFVPFSPKVPQDWAVFAALGVITSYLGYWIYGEAVRRLNPSKAAVVATLEPVLATFFAWWWWDEAFASVGWVGTALILGAVILLILEKVSPDAPDKKRAAAQAEAGEATAEISQEDSTAGAIQEKALQ